ncbi:transketolase [Oenococcus sp. UCMA 17063]|nr:transketolase [Oenococcus sp. UCMA 17063]
MENSEITKLSKIANELRLNVLDSVYKAQSGHIGGSFSAAEIISYLYFHCMNVDPKKPNWAKRDRFVLSKGHAAPVLYSALAKKGYFPEEQLATLRQIGTMLQGHPDMLKTPGIDMSTGSLGQGLAAAVGMALGLKYLSSASYVYCVIGDGEIDEGEIWESIMNAPKFKLDNLIVFLDRNGVQLDGPTSKVMNIDPVADKFRAFNWNVLSINGHRIPQIDTAVVLSQSLQNGKPNMIVANTTKGKGVSFMENKSYWHGTAPNLEQYTKARKEILKKL